MGMTFNCGSQASMTGAADCTERLKPVEQRNWVVTKRNYNTSAFNGYHPTRSDYSTVRCLSCGAVGRTKAKYVAHLRDES